MNKKIFDNVRFTPKGDIETNWKKAVGFIPLDKEIIIYKPDETHSAARFKVGDGKTEVNDLPFAGVDIKALEQLIDEKGKLLIEYVDNAVIATTEALTLIKEKDTEQDEKLAVLEGRVTYFTVNIHDYSAKQLSLNFDGATKVDWGDGTINNELSHIYDEWGIYNVKVYDAVAVGGKVFGNIPSIDDIVLSKSIKEIRQDAFAGVFMHNIVIPDSVTSISDGAFKYCTSLTEIVIPDSVTSIGKEAFFGCSELKNIIIPSNVANIGTGAFNIGLTSLSIVFKNYNPINYNSMFGPPNEYFKVTTYVPYGCKQAYIDKWAAEGAPQDILDKIVESDREAMMSDLEALVFETATTEDIANIFKEA